MRKVIRKWFWIWDFDKEEKWLNEMAARGLALCAVGYCRYEFEECRPGEYGVRLELLKNKPSHPESEQYIRFIEDTGAEQVGSYLSWVYFRKKTAEGAFDLHSDLDSRIRHLTGIQNLVLALALINLIPGIYNAWLWICWNSPVSSVGLLNFAVMFLGLFGWFRLNRKRQRLLKERQIFES